MGEMNMGKSAGRALALAFFAAAAMLSISSPRAQPAGSVGAETRGTGERGGVEARTAGEAAVPPKVEARRLGGDVYLLSGGGGANSTALVGPDGALLVDSKIDEASAEAVAAALRTLGAARVRFLINTHEHPDHTGGNALFGREGAIILAHEAARSVLAAGQRGGPPAPVEALPSATIAGNGTATLYLNGETVEVRKMPAAHTEGNVLVRYVKADVYHLGDLYTRVRYPVLAGGTLRGFIDSVNRVLEMADARAKFVPGVGDVGDREDLAAYRNMLVTVRNRVAALVKQGKSLEEVEAAKPTADFDSTYGKPGPLFLPPIYKELAGGE
jgi:glyoxylase-like metal-dependent hydrolase (beta-lactamase superfamily II)